jgi:hypothetical protein
MLLQQEAILRRDQEWLHLTSSLLAVASGEGGGSAGDFEYNNVTGRETVVPYFLKGICDESSSWTYHIGSFRVWRLGVCRCGLASVSRSQS